MILNDRLKDFRIILASQSPRRKMLLAGLDLSFEVLVRKGVEETFPDDLSMTEIPEYLARSKSDHYTDLLDDKTLVITADTIVWHKNEVVGKPRDPNHAMEIISRLSGNTHEVVTGVCIRSENRMKVFHSISKVEFRTLTREEIQYYVHKYQPLDKAGAYGIQEWIGYIGIEKIEGSFYNVMGLPVQTLYHELSAYS